MTVRISMSATGAKRLATRMSNRANFLGSSRMRGLMQEAGKEAVAQAQATAAAFVPGRVADLSPEYREQKAKRYGHAYPILTGTGALLASMYSRVFQTEDAGWLIKVGFAGQHPGSNISNEKLAAIHNARRPFINLPARWGAQVVARIRAELKSIR